MSLVPRMAKAMALANGETVNDWPGYVSMAEAALLSLRKPTRTMLDAGSRHTRIKAPLCNVWQAMIDRAMR